MYARNSFQIQAVPIYDFYLSEEGHILYRTYDKYMKMSDRPGRPIPNTERYEYRIYANPGIIVKNNRQMNRFLNGHLYTFDSDINNAAAVIKAAYEQKLADARAMAIKCETILGLMKSTQDCPSSQATEDTP